MTPIIVFKDHCKLQISFTAIQTSNNLTIYYLKGVFKSNFEFKFKLPRRRLVDDQKSI